MAEFLLRVLVLLRLLCFMALVYLGLYALLARVLTKPGSKMLWFFAVLTAPLLAPLRHWRATPGQEKRLVSEALIVYGVLWMLTVLMTRLLSGARL